MRDTGGPAFPQKGASLMQKDNVIFLDKGGMTLRDYFAAQSLSGCMIWDSVINGKNSLFSTDGPKSLAELSYKIADAMIAERNKP